jgi:hypothetical protein
MSEAFGQLFQCDVMHERGEPCLLIPKRHFAYALRPIDARIRLCVRGA